MDVFISWSGERSKAAAEALRNWLPQVINAVRPWLSAADIDKGARWATDIAGKLEISKVGILCLTPSNLHADWILFEAGALAKTVKNTYVCPLLFDLEPSAIEWPLAQFQATRANKDEVKKLLGTVNSALGEDALAVAHLDEAFEMWWPRLATKFNNLPSDNTPANPVRKDREILEEILALVRNQSRAEAPEMQMVSDMYSSRRQKVNQALKLAARAVGINLKGTEYLSTYSGDSVHIQFDQNGTTGVLYLGNLAAPLDELVSELFHQLRQLPSPKIDPAP